MWLFVQNRCRRVRAVEESVRRGLGPGDVVRAPADPFLAGRQPGLLVGRPVAPVALRAGEQGGWIADEADGAVAVGDQPGGGRVSAAEVVDEDSVGLDAGGRAAREDDRGGAEHVRGEVALRGAGRDDDHAVHPPGHQVLDQLPLALDLFGGVAEDEGRVPPRPVRRPARAGSRRGSPGW